MLKSPAEGVSGLAIDAAQGAVDPGADVAVSAKLIRNSARDYARQTFPPARLRDWAVLAIRNGFPVSIVIEAAAEAVGRQLAELPFMLRTPEASAPQIALIAETAMREAVEAKIAALVKAHNDKAAIDAKVQS